MGGGSNGAQHQAQANEDRRNAQIKASTRQINRIFDSPGRTAQYGQLAKDTSAYFMQDLDTQKGRADRNLKFSLARNGQTGGSVQTDQGAQLGKDYLKGVLETTRRGQGAAADLQSRDETARANLIAQAQGGLDATSAASNAASALRSNLQSGQATSTANQMGDMFGDFASIYQKSQDAAALHNGQLYAYNTVYQPGFGYGAQGGR